MFEEKCLLVNKLFTTEAYKPLTEEQLISKFAELHGCPWKENEQMLQQYRNQLMECCNASKQLIVTQENTPLGYGLVYETEKTKSITVTPEMFKMFAERSPFPKQRYKTCSVVGNAGNLLGSFCGEEIDQAEYVFRLNLPPLNYTDDVGTKVDLVTANPSIMVLRFDGLNNRRRSFAEMMKAYQKAFIVMPAFSYVRNTELSFKVQYTLEDFGLDQKVLFFHPVYLDKLAQHWKAKGLTAVRLSSGLMVVSAALELCDRVTLYGFWPFDNDVLGNPVLHHYYDNKKPSPGVHQMSSEFSFYTKMHSHGALRLIMGKCF